jgi:hypothetical protein
LPFFGFEPISGFESGYLAQRAALDARGVLLERQIEVPR